MTRQRRPSSGRSSGMTLRNSRSKPAHPEVARGVENAGTVVFESSQGEQWPVVAVHVVSQIKDAREPGAGGLGLGPATVGGLNAHQVLDATPNRAAVEGGGLGRSTGGDEAHEGPSGLGRGAGAF